MDAVSEGRAFTVTVDSHRISELVPLGDAAVSCLGRSSPRSRAAPV